MPISLSLCYVFIIWNQKADLLLSPVLARLVNVIKYILYVSTVIITIIVSVVLNAKCIMRFDAFRRTVHGKSEASVFVLVRMHYACVYKLTDYRLHYSLLFEILIRKLWAGVSTHLMNFNVFNEYEKRCIWFYDAYRTPGSFEFYLRGGCNTEPTNIICKNK